MIVDGNLGNHGNVGNDGICSMPFFRVLETLVYIHFFSSKKTPYLKGENAPFIERSLNSRQCRLLPSLPSLPQIIGGIS